MPIYGLKLLTEEGTSLTDEYGRVHYPVGEWVSVPGNGTDVAMEVGYFAGEDEDADQGDLLLAQFECDASTETEPSLFGVSCFRRVRRLAKIDMEWVKTLSVPMRIAVARRGTDEHRDALLHDPDRAVRYFVAIFGTDAHRTTLLNDPDREVRWRIAIHGNNEHRTALLNDPYTDVRVAVAYNGNNEHRAILEHDPDAEVRDTVQQKRDALLSKRSASCPSMD